MSIQHSIWSLDEKNELETSKLESENELEQLLTENITILNSEWMLIGRQVLTSSHGYIDLLCIDRAGDLIVIELKKDLTPREVTMQAIDYAACVNDWTYSMAAEAFSKFNDGKESLEIAFNNRFKTSIDPENFNGNPIKIVIVASQMDAVTERIVKYLETNYEMPIDILFFKVFKHQGKRLLSRSWFMQEKEANPKPNIVSKSWNGEFYVSFGEDKHRNWQDAKKYGFISAGGGTWYTQTLDMLSEGDRVWVNIPKTGYVGVGIVTGSKCIAKDAILMVNDEEKDFTSLSLNGEYMFNNDEETGEYLVPIKWIMTLDKKNAVHEEGFFGNQNTVCKPKTSSWQFTIEKLKHLWSI